VDEILAQIQGVDDYKNILLVIAATNFPDKIDSAFLRPGRFDELIYVGLPNDKEKIILLEKGLSIFKKCEVNFKAILPLIKNHSCADIQYIIDKIKIYAVDFEVKFKKEFILTQSILKNKIVDTSSSVDMNDLRRIIAYASGRNVNSN
jgi:transitional endoplasmic reticulum ATPase